MYAVHIFLSKLRASNRQPHFLNIAVISFDVLIENHEGTVFPLHNADIVLICSNVLVDDADGALDKVRALFGEDPRGSRGWGLRGQLLDLVRPQQTGDSSST